MIDLHRGMFGKRLVAGDAVGDQGGQHGWVEIIDLVQHTDRVGYFHCSVSSPHTVSTIRARSASRSTPYLRQILRTTRWRFHASSQPRAQMRSTITAIQSSAINGPSLLISRT